MTKEQALEELKNFVARLDDDELVALGLVVEDGALYNLVEDWLCRVAPSQSGTEQVQAVG